MTIETKYGDNFTMAVILDTEMTMYLMDLCGEAEIEPHELLCDMLKETHEAYFGDDYL